VLLQKLGLALGLFIVGITLEASGLQSAQPGQSFLPTQPESALWAIRLVIGPIPALLLIAGMVLTYFYPISREVFAEILLKLSERRRQQDAPPENS
jgi:glycoside/pentoside/hexuronide:cation symporter, GPH family